MNIEFDHIVLTKKQATTRRALEMLTAIVLMTCATLAVCGFAVRGQAEGWPMDLRMGFAFLSALTVLFPFWLLPLPSFTNELDAKGRARLQTLARRWPELAPVIHAWLADETLELRKEDLRACEEYVAEQRKDRAGTSWRLAGRVS
ncbi:hypothetical protein [Ancylobacter oerskovii]|uniref:Uncharacterized protein n=1 Tax=Ancylobacter oerskovii TaxID=459519 RepID=A0ABW4Z5C8_9HYPH|nr:hypothetical protein [Ancylobacter oerskovii]MBS7545550.1 hypothetical protein [Ancylobacter oerskovii]